MKAWFSRSSAMDSGASCSTFLMTLRTTSGRRFRLILTENIPEEPDLPVSRYPFPIEVVKNLKRRGFGANHNAALGRSRGELFCVLNPDIRIPSDPFPVLWVQLRQARSLAW